MSRYINTDELEEVKDVMYDIFGNGMYAVRMSDIRELPTADVVEVVRCKNCVYWQTNWVPNMGGDLGRHYCGMIDSSTEPLMYCGYGERREDET